MWKYVTRRIRDTFERNVNHFDRRSATVVNSPGSVNDDKKKQSTSPCRWWAPHKCWNSFQSDNDTHDKKWNFEHLNRSWIGAITWSSALAFGWYTSQLIHLKLKCKSRDKSEKCNSINNLLNSLQPYITCGTKEVLNINSVSTIEAVIKNFVPTVHMISNEHGANKEKASSASGSSTATDNSDSELGNVLNSIENRLGLAAIENGQYQDGLSLLRSAANRNHAPALYNLGLCYEKGLGVNVDEKAAMELYRSAAALQHPRALYNLGIYYGQGRGGLSRDTETATRLLRLAAVQGQQDAIDALKTLDIDTPQPRADDDSWSYRYTPFAQNEHFVPTQSTLFVENVNYLKVI